jgi:hypothetical protein
LALSGARDFHLLLSEIPDFIQQFSFGYESFLPQQIDLRLLLNGIAYKEFFKGNHFSRTKFLSHVSSPYSIQNAVRILANSLRTLLLPLWQN